MLTIVISNNHTSGDMLHTLKSIAGAPGADRAQIILLNSIENEFSLDQFGALNIQSMDGVKDHDMSTFAAALAQARGDYILYANSGDTFDRSFFVITDEYIRRAMEIQPSRRYNIACVACGKTSYEDVASGNVRPTRSYAELVTEKVSLYRLPQDVPTEVTGMMFRTDVMKRVGIDPTCKLDALKLTMVQMLNMDDGYTIIRNEILQSCYPTTTDSVLFAGMHDPDWYYNSLEKYVLAMLKTVREGVRAKDFAQYLALYELKWRYEYNRNSNDKHIIDNEFDRFVYLCKEILDQIDNSVLFNLSNTAKYRMPMGMNLALFNTKYGAKIDTDYIYDKANILRVFDTMVMAKARNLRVILEVLEYEDGVLTIDASVDDFMDMKSCRLVCYNNTHKVKLQETYRYAHTKFFGVSTNKRYTFRIKLPDEVLDEENNITFYLCYGTFSVQLPMVTRRYTAKISSSVSYSYWMYGSDRRVVYFRDDANVLAISHLSKLSRLARELKLLVHMVTDAEKAPGMLVTRAMYWLTRPFFKNKRIWLTYDKLYKGGDCGEYFYKYMKSRDDGIIPCYVINGDAEDMKRLRREGYRPLAFGSMRNRLYYMNAEAVFATHGGVHSFNGISNSRVKYVSDLLFAEVTCIQHGLSVQQLAQELNRAYNNTKRYYCASKYEIKNLEHPIYGYEDKSVLRLTGIPRYDGLVSHDKRQILITPTWRAYISMPPVMGQSRPYYPEFKKTDYYKFYYNLLTDERLIATARRTGYKLIYLLHPIISSQIVDYPQIDGVEIIPATSVNYEQILTESSLMLTDYSGVQFDFAYMRKPVVYYHPPELPPHYKEGGFFYDTMGFGEICTTHDEMVGCLCEYMENECRMKPFYQDRADDFFAYSDRNSCERIYQDFTEYINAKKGMVKHAAT